MPVNYTLIDAQAQHKATPDTFEVPDDAILKNLKSGDRVKVCDGVQRFWVHLTRVYRYRLRGFVDDGMWDNPERLQAGDGISLERRHIYDTDVDGVVS